MYGYSISVAKPAMAEGNYSCDPRGRVASTSCYLTLTWNYLGFRALDYGLPQKSGDIQGTRTAENANYQLETSPLGNGRTLDRVADRSAHTRWTSNRSQQVGDEVLTFRFSHPTPTRGLELDPGEYSTDFPRGLTVRGGPCREEEARQLAYFPSWQGALSFTTDGFPYFSGQSDVRMLFGKEESVECIFVRQTSAAPFAWSVAEARMLPH
jgi:hypothetical protein